MASQFLKHSHNTSTNNKKEATALCLQAEEAVASFYKKQRRRVAKSQKYTPPYKENLEQPYGEATYISKAFPGGEGGPFMVDEGNRNAPNKTGEASPSPTR